MRILAALSAALLLFSAPALAGDETAELVGHWGAVFTSKKLVRVPVLRDRPTVSLAGPGMVTKRGPLFSTVLRDEEVPMEVEHSVTLEIEADGRFKLSTYAQRAASPTNPCLVRAGSVREGRVSQTNGRVLLRSSAGRARSAGCEEKPQDAPEGESAYMVRRDGDTLVVTGDDGTVWQLRK